MIVETGRIMLFFKTAGYIFKMGTIMSTQKIIQKITVNKKACRSCDLQASNIG
jgi:hypothetical protein